MYELKLGSIRVAGDGQEVSNGDDPQEALEGTPGADHESILTPGVHRLKRRLDAPPLTVNARDGASRAREGTGRVVANTRES